MRIQGGKLNQLAVDKQLRTQRALELRIAGLNFRDIVNQLKLEFGDRIPPGYSENMCSKDLQFALNNIKAEIRESAENMIELELQRLDQMMLIFMDKALTGDVKAGNMVLRIMERRSRYLGMDKPAQVTVKDWRSEVLELVRMGRISIDDVRRELGDEQTRQLLESGSISVIEGREIPGEEQAEDRPVQDELAPESSAL